MMLARPIRFSFLLLASTVVAGAALADPPTRVGRLSFVEGTVSQHLAQDNDWSPAILNYPVTTGASFWTEPYAKSEIQVGVADVRMDQSTELDVMQLDYGATRLQLPQGEINVHLRQHLDAPIQITTPLGEVDLSEPGSYHINAGHSPDDETPPPQMTLTVLDGTGQIRGPESPLVITAGETATVAGNPPLVTLAQGGPTVFDDWALDRDRREAVASRYLSPHMTGGAELDQYGSWNNVPQYGAVWYPQNVPAGWAPYRDGHWAYVAPWGWTWVDNAPWGFAPFHYGRWVQDGGRWGWCPGREVERPVYAPALVAFIGGVGISIASAPSVGWVPLGPSEPFHPYYQTSPAYVKNVNGGASDRRNDGRHRHADRGAGPVTINQYINNQAVTVMRSNAFAKGASVQAARVNVPSAQLAAVHPVATLAQIIPTVSAVRGGGETNINRLEHMPRPPGAPMTRAIPRPAFSPSARTQPVTPPFSVRAQKVGAHNLQMPEPIKPAHTPLPAGVVPGPVIHHVPLREPTLQHEDVHQLAPVALEPAHPRPVTGQPASPVLVFHRPPSPPARPEPQIPARMPDAPRHGWPESEARHPQQQGRIAPTPQGWQRQGEAHAASVPAPQPAPPQAPHRPAPHEIGRGMQPPTRQHAPGHPEEQPHP